MLLRLDNEGQSHIWPPGTWRDDGDLNLRDFVINELRRTCPPEELPDWARPH